MTEIQIHHIEPDPETVIVTPDELEYVYQRADSGDDVLGILLDDPTLGSMFIALSIEQATDIANNLGGLVANLDNVRAEWDKDHPHD